MIDLDILGSGDRNMPMTVSGSPISGVKLLGQRVLVLLLSNMSEMLREDEGSTLINAIGSGTYDDEYTYLLLYSSIYRVLDILKNDSAEYPDDETIYDISIESVKTIGDTIEVSILVTSQAGNTTTINTQTGPIYGY